MKNLYKIVLVLLLTSSSIFADGLMMPVNESYPKDFLRNKLTNIDVIIEGMISKTIVYQEFLNESDLKTDAVYSFPLPPDARAVNVLYWYKDTLYQAVLKVQEQSPNPGTGDGGVAALVNAYIGRNGLKVYFKNIEPHSLQKVELHYISLLDFHKGEAKYIYPLFTKTFVDYPIDILAFKATINSKQPIIDASIMSHSGYSSKSESPNKTIMSFQKSKAYLDKNIELSFSITNEITDIDFYSIDNDSTDGHFAMALKYPNSIDSTLTFDNRIVYLISTSSRMTGIKLQQSIESTKNSLDLLKPTDKFTIVNYNSIVQQFSDDLVNANSTNIENAKGYLDGLTSRYGNSLDQGLETSLSFFEDDSNNNAIIAFTDGRSPLDPYYINQRNTQNVGIFFIGIGNEIDRSKLEMTSLLNYGFVKYFNEENYDKREVVKVFEKISRPLIKNSNLDFKDGIGVNSLVPSISPTGFAGYFSFVTGRYQEPGFSQISLLGDNIDGPVNLNYQVEFADDNQQGNFAEKYWAKEMIDMLERKTDIYGETPAWKDSLIELSLKYNIRCRYTAYIADYENIIASTNSVDENLLIPKSFIQSNYPNPFNPSTKIRFYLSNSSIGKVKFIKIFNILGQLINIIDISHLNEGWNEIVIYGKNYIGEELATGIYIASLEINGEIKNSIKLILVK